MLTCVKAKVVVNIVLVITVQIVVKAKVVANIVLGKYVHTVVIGTQIRLSVVSIV